MNDKRIVGVGDGASESGNQRLAFAIYYDPLIRIPEKKENKNTCNRCKTSVPPRRRLCDKCKVLAAKEAQEKWRNRNGR